MGILDGKTFSIIIQGCRTNQYEGEAIAAALEAAGAVHDEKSADITVIVSCTITAQADRKCRKLIRKVRRENPASLVIACGCYAQKISAEEKTALGLDIVVGNRLKHLIPQLAYEHWKNGGTTDFSVIPPKDILTEPSWDGLVLDRPRLHTRAFLKVQDGCNHYCSYCIVPYVRGNPVSRDLGETIKEAEKIVASGCPEIVLTGIHIGLYDNLPQLVLRIGAIKGLRRLRFGSIEPFAVNDALLEALAETPAFCRHLHMPLQSGDDKVLNLMRRGYDSAGFKKMADRARARLGDDLHISTDLMVGFPEEDDAAFKNSMDFIKDTAFGKVHVFPYSPREGTDAAKMKLPPEKAVHERVTEALTVAEELHLQYCSRWIARESEILVEERNNGVIKGLTTHYVRVSAKDDGTMPASLTTVCPQKYHSGMLICDGVADLVDDSEFGSVI